VRESLLLERVRGGEKEGERFSTLLHARRRRGVALRVMTGDPTRCTSFTRSRNPAFPQAISVAGISLWGPKLGAGKGVNNFGAIFSLKPHAGGGDYQNKGPRRPRL
jgi:hypothetical protein